jgi:hypothetical protein
VRVPRWFSDLSTQIHTFLREVKVSERVADDLMVVPPAQMRHRSADELVAYGLDMSIASPTKPPTCKRHASSGSTARPLCGARRDDAARRAPARHRRSDFDEKLTLFRASG